VILQGLGLVCHFGERAAVDGLDVGVEEGEVMGLLGPNGAGKSTAFQLLAGLRRLQGGVVRLAGSDVSSLPLHRRARRGLGYLPQGPSVFPGLSVRDNVRIGRRGATSAQVDAMLGAEDLLDLAHHKAGRLSGGERRRVELARVIFGRPKVVLLDEPFAGVDPVHVQVLRQRIRAMADDGVGVLLTDHAVGQALWICDRCSVMDHGVARATGLPREVAADPWVRKAYLGTDFSMRVVRK